MPADWQDPPLAGIRVVDFTTFLSGPFCTQILGDLGADVVKIEPLTGDSSRSIPPHFVADDSAYFLSCNRNKRSVSLDLKATEGLAAASELIHHADVVVENFRPGVAGRLGLDPDMFRRRRPGLIWASISGFGQQGPWRDRPAYDIVVQALSGVMSLTGEPGEPPVRLGIPVGDLVAGMYAVIGIVAALRGHEESGRGRTIDISMLDSQLSLLSYQSVYALISGMVPQPQGSGHDSIPTYRAFTAGDGRRLVVAANTDRMWRSLCVVLGLPELPADDRFTTASRRLKHREELWQVLEPAFLARPATIWADELTIGGVPAAVIKTVPEALSDARDANRGLILDLEDDRADRIEVIGDPITFTGQPPLRHRYPPRLGQHTRAVLAEDLGWTPRRIDQLAEAGIIAAPMPAGVPSEQTGEQSAD